MSSELNNVLIKIKTLDNNKNIILYKNIIIIDNLEVEHDFIEFIENLNIDFLEESMIL